MIKKKCPYCNKEYEGFSEKQVDHFINLHILSKHKEKIQMKGGGK